MEGEIVDINGTLKQVVKQRFSIRHSFEFPEAWVATSPLDHCLLAWCSWWLVTVKEKKDYVPNYKDYVEPCDPLDEFPQAIVYHRRGKIRWAKRLQFQPHWSFCGNTLALPWPELLITRGTYIHEKTFEKKSWQPWKFSPVNLSPFMVVSSTTGVLHSICS